MTLVTPGGGNDADASATEVSVDAALTSDDLTSPQNFALPTDDPDAFASALEAALADEDPDLLTGDQLGEDDEAMGV